MDRYRLVQGTVVLLAMAWLMGLASMSPALAKQPKVTLCHNGHEITIAEPAVQAHLQHGDSLGGCGNSTAVVQAVEVQTAITAAADYPWQPPAGQSGDYRYLYYPDAGVYFDPAQSIYYYNDGQQWQHSATLTDDLQQRLLDFVLVETMAVVPYQYHQAISQVYGAPGSMASAAEQSLYQYRYYPESQVYYDEIGETYYQQQSGQWQSVETLPSALAGALGGFMAFSSTAPQPYQSHQALQQTLSQALQAGLSTLTEQAVQPYRYYPDANVYQDTGRDLYFFQQQGQWQQAPNLPAGLSVQENNGIELHLSTRRPYLYHQQLRQQRQGLSGGSVDAVSEAVGAAVGVAVGAAISSEAQAKTQVKTNKIKVKVQVKTQGNSKGKSKGKGKGKGKSKSKSKSKGKKK